MSKRILRVWKPDMDMSERSVSIGIFAMRRGGKSHLIRHLYETCFRKTDVTVVYTLSPETKQYYENFILCHSEDNSNVVCGSPDDNLLDRIDELQTKRKAEGKRPLRILIILDDAITQKSKYSEMLTQIFLRGRHSNVSIIFATQQHSFFAQSWKQNLDLMFIGKTSIGSTRDYFAKNFLHMVDRKVAARVLSQTNDHRFIVINVNAPDNGETDESNDLQDVYIYRAPNIETKRRKKHKQPDANIEAPDINMDTTEP